MKIVVAGAGHGGLVAAAAFAKAGYDVTVCEKAKKEDLGHDWEDRFDFDLLLGVTGKDSLPDDSWRYRGDCAFVSPDHKTQVVINYSAEDRQKIMWRKFLISELIANARQSGVKFFFETQVISPIIKNGKVAGIVTATEDITADLVIDAAGVFSPLRTKLPEAFGIEKEPARGDVFYAYRAYFNKTDDGVMPEVPFEVYLAHEHEQGLSWCCTNPDSVDILIGRIDPLDGDALQKHIDNFRKKHPYIGEDIVNGGRYGVIPVRRPLSLMVAPGYAAVGDSAFMTTPMNGMGIDLSLLAGELLAEKVIAGGADIGVLWEYNRDFHRLYGGDTAKNEGLKNSLLEMPGIGVDFLFANQVIQSSDLAGAGKNTNLGSLLGKFVRGMRAPKYFFAIINGLLKGAKLASALKKAPENYDLEKINLWQQKVNGKVLRITRK